MSHHCFWDFLNLFVYSLLRKEWFLPVWIYFCGECWHSYPHFTCHFQARRLIWFSYYELLTAYSFNVCCSKAVHWSAEINWEREECWTKTIGFSSVKSDNVQHIYVPNGGKRKYRWILWSNPSHMNMRKKKCLCLWIIPKEECLWACKGGISIPNGELENTED